MEMEGRGQTVVYGMCLLSGTLLRRGCWSARAEVKEGGWRAFTCLHSGFARRSNDDLRARYVLFGGDAVLYARGRQERSRQLAAAHACVDGFGEVIDEHQRGS
jgi:hypothetical protein